MSEYINKEDAIASAKALLFCYGSDDITDEQLDEYAEEFMNDDNNIIEVVRCKDCKYKEHEKCGLTRYTIRPYDYCSYGEREEK